MLGKRPRLGAQVHVQVTPWLSHVFRLYDNVRHLEFEWEAGPLPRDGGGMQVMMLMMFYNARDHHDRDHDNPKYNYNRSE